MNSLQSILAGKGAEFFTHEDEPLVTYKRAQYHLDEAPKYIHNILDNFLSNNPDKAEAYKDMAGEQGVKVQCVKCLFANLDGTPDLCDRGILHPEYVDCPNRKSNGGKCKWEGIGCLKDPFDLSKREKQIVEILNLEELTVQQLADRLFISKFTADTHMQNIRKKTGSSRRAGVTLKIRPSLTLQQWK